MKKSFILLLLMLAGIQPFAQTRIPVLVKERPGEPANARVKTSVACDCGAWGNLIVNDRVSYKSGNKITGNCNRVFRFSTFYQCRPSGESCNAGSTWQVTKDGSMVKNNTSGKNISADFTPTGNGTYVLTLNATCNNKQCDPVSYYIVVTDCKDNGGGDGGGVSGGGGTVACDCGAWGNLIVNDRVSYKSGNKITGYCNRVFRFSTFYQCRPSDESCNAGTTWQVTKDGAMIKNNTSGKNISADFTPTNNGTYTLTLNATCNNKRCDPVSYSIVVSDCK